MIWHFITETARLFVSDEKRKRAIIKAVPTTYLPTYPYYYYFMCTMYITRYNIYLLRFVIHNAVTRDKWLFFKQSDKYGFLRFAGVVARVAVEGA